jgi:hypothetical protein
MALAVLAQVKGRFAKPEDDDQWVTLYPLEETFNPSSGEANIVAKQKKSKSGRK